MNRKIVYHEKVLTEEEYFKVLDKNRKANRRRFDYCEKYCEPCENKKKSYLNVHGFDIFGGYICDKYNKILIYATDVCRKEGQKNG